MIIFQKHTLANGLRVLLHRDDSTPMVAISLAYDVGSRDERADKTGFAHLFEHLMFSGSENAPDFDDPLQRAGGENNACTNTDSTIFYELMPAENLETALWLEADRMAALDINQKSLKIQRKVVVEEFKETTLNEPYGDNWHHLSEMHYREHPYRWPVIGLVPKHIEKAKLEDVTDFFAKHYAPNNAVLAIAGRFEEENALKLVEKYFADIPRAEVPIRNLPVEPPKNGYERRDIEDGKTPVDAVFLAFRVPGRIDADFYPVDLLTDVLANGTSSRLFRRLLKENPVFSSIDAYLTASEDPGLLVVEGKMSAGFSLDQGVEAIWKELNLMKNEPISAHELQKIQNRFESTVVFSEISVLNKAQSLCSYELLGDANLINSEIATYESVSAVDIQRIAQQYLTLENCAELRYLTPKAIETS
jgi:zinc protease